MSQKEVAIVGKNNTKAEVTGANELLVKINSLATSAGLATEATLLQILNNMIASQDIEILLVRDTGNADKVIQQIREYDQGTSTWITRYEDVDGTTYVPVGPLEYLDPSAVLNLMLTELLDQGLTLDNILIAIGNIYSTIHVEEDDNVIPEGLTLPTSIVELYGNWDGAWQRLTTDGNNRLVIAADSLPLPTGAATQATLASVLAELQSTLDVNVTNATLAVTQSGAWTVTANQGTSPWVVGGTIALDAGTLAALETITVNQGTSPWTVNGTVNAAQSGVWTVALDASTLAALETITVQQGTTPWVVSGTVALDASTLAALETITVNQGTSPWIVSATDLDIRDLVFATDKVDVSGSSNVAVTDGGGSLTVDGTVAATQSGTWDINNISGTISLPTGAATETTLSGINTKLTSVVRTPNLLRATGTGTIAPVVYDFSVANVGAANGTILGGTIKPGETLNFSAGTLNNSYAAASIAYDGTGTELVIIYNS